MRFSDWVIVVISIYLTKKYVENPRTKKYEGIEKVENALQFFKLEIYFHYILFYI